MVLRSIGAAPQFGLTARALAARAMQILRRPARADESACRVRSDASGKRPTSGITFGEGLEELGHVFAAALEGGVGTSAIAERFRGAEGLLVERSPLRDRYPAEPLPSEPERQTRKTTAATSASASAMVVSDCPCLAATLRTTEDIGRMPVMQQEPCRASGPQGRSWVLGR